MTFENLLKLIEVLKWPLVVVGSVGLVALFFRKQCVGFLSRLTSVGKDGLKAAPAASQETQPAREHQVNDLMKAFDSNVLLAQEHIIKNDLKDKGLNHVGATVDVLVRHLAQTQILYHLAESYRTIFGSQIFLLKKINQQASISSKEAEIHFLHIQKRFPELADWNLDKYMTYLVDRRLVGFDQGLYSITPLGVEFLGWMVRVGAAENPPL